MLIEPPVPVYVMSHRNCEIHCCHLDGYKAYRDALIQRLNKVEGHFMGAPKSRQYRLWYNVDGTVLDTKAIAEICASLVRISHHIFRIAFVGVPLPQRLLFDREIKKAIPGQPLPHRYFSDAEKAKDWLV